MREGKKGSHKIRGETLAPRGSIDYIKSSTAWNIKYDPNSGNFYFQTTDYHPGDLELTIQDIEMMLRYAKDNKKI